MTTAAITPALIIEIIEDSYEDIRTEYVVLDGFLFVGDESRLPFATVITNDSHDPHSNLSRPGVFRLNIGISKASFQALFGAEKIVLPDGERNESGYDFTAFDRVMPHPVYGFMHWICVVSPTAETFARLRPLIDEAVAMATARVERRGSQSGVRYLIDPSNDPSNNPE